MRSSIDYKGNNSCSFCSIPRGLTPAGHGSSPENAIFLSDVFFFFFLRNRRSRFFSLFQIFDTRDKKKFEINDNKITIFIKIKILLHYSFSR